MNHPFRKTSQLNELTILLFRESRKFGVSAMSTGENIVESVKEAVTAPLPKPPALHEKASAHELKNRLEWGEPALTIVDVRDRKTFNKGHITGAMNMPLGELVDRIQGVDRKRDIYLYSNSDEETASAASQLREAGFANVAELRGGLTAWKAIAGPTDGSEERVELNAASYNVVSRIAHHIETQNKDV
jgi:rhodanese-related sulfurtransferase